MTTLKSLGIAFARAGRPVVTLFLLTHLANAQSTAPTTAMPKAKTAMQGNAADDETVTLKEFVVTDNADVGYSTPNAIGLTRSNEALIDTPQTINVLNQQFLRSRVHESLSGVLADATDTRTRFELLGFCEVDTLLVH